MSLLPHTRRRDWRVAGPLMGLGAMCILIGLWQGCALEAAWQNTYTFNGTLDHYAEQSITNPEYIKRFNLTINGKFVRLNICGPAVLKRTCGRVGGSQCVIGHNVYVLGGPMDNGRDYLSQWGLGHELGHVLGYDVDHLCEGF